MSAVSRLASKFLGRAKEGPVVPEGFVPITEILPEDVVVVGYPKSGNTWFQNLVCGVVYGLMPEFAPPGLVHRHLVPDVHDAKFYRRYATPTFFKSHFLPRPEYRRVIYLLRDGRDAMVSYFHHLKALQPQMDFLELVRRGTFPSKWHEHVEAWLANPHQAEMITVKYEDLKTNPIRELQRFCSFVHIKRDLAHLETIARSAEFDKMQKREREQGMGSTDREWPRNKLFTRRGEIGSYKDEMPAEVLGAFLEEADPTLRRTGYL